MVLVAVFGAALLVAVLLSGLAARTVLSTSLLFLLGGALVSDGFLGLIHVTPESEIVAVTADLALFAVLFTDGMHVSFAKLRANWRNPARALGLGMPLACVGMALVAHYLVGLDWTTSFLVGAVLAPTASVRLRDRGPQGGPGPAAGAAERRERYQRRARPAGGPRPHRRRRTHRGWCGGVVRKHRPGTRPRPRLRRPAPVDRQRARTPAALRRRAQAATPAAAGHRDHPVRGLRLTHANPYLAAFSAGAVLAAVAPESHKVFEPLGEALAELAKFAALLVFGALLTPQLFGDLSWGGYAAAVLAIVLIRPGSLLLSLWGTRIDRREKLVAAWFGPKGFASVVYGLLVLQAGIPQGQQAYTLIAVCIAFSIIAHSSTDVPIARLFHVDDLVDTGTTPPKTSGGGTSTGEAIPHARA